MNTWLKMNLDMKIESTETLILRNSAVPWSSSRTKMWERPFMALKKITTQRSIACTVTGNGAPPAVRLMAMVTMAAKDTETLRANLLLNSTMKSFLIFRSMSLPKPDNPAAQFFLGRVVRGQDDDFFVPHRFQVRMEKGCAAGIQVRPRFIEHQDRRIVHDRED